VAIYTSIALENADAFNRLNQTLNSLKKTQTQLVQSEKMASLGELTAGIAHEIQNPLNFINNFSDINAELLDEMMQELQKGNTSDVVEISQNIRHNLEKIAHHGKRADSIVKSMLQHSRKSTGQKEPTDVNALVDEFLRLSYHGLRAKDKSFNSLIETHFDPAVGKVNVVGQDISRVLLNIFNNAFYAVNEKKKAAENGYEPVVQVTTHQLNEKIEIRIKDNGTGIPEKVLEKIYQPFFTTKPAGEGTGLGLSLSYDIITKGHGGELKVETQEGNGSEFIIQLPLSK
jgi:signal transduction histidine kinase